ncbi:MAG: dihydrodipicolinate reductase, partial [Planctomycetes bacterium]|nr:dihydrodipicolinate reductase [Planctomycetota bacterium]
MKTLRVIQCGLGPIGLMTTREMVRKGGLEIVAAIDVSPALIGRDLGELAGLKEPLGVKVSRDVEAE